jgi:hypothetical protein
VTFFHIIYIINVTDQLDPGVVSESSEPTKRSDRPGFQRYRVTNRSATAQVVFPTRYNWRRRDRFGEQHRDCSRKAISYSKCTEAASVTRIFKLPVKLTVTLPGQGISGGPGPSGAHSGTVPVSASVMVVPNPRGGGGHHRPWPAGPPAGRWRWSPSAGDLFKFRAELVDILVTAEDCQ